MKTTDALSMAEHDVRRAAVDEAIARLNLITPDARSVVLTMLADGTGEHPRSLCTAYRKQGPQLSRDELKAAGMRSNAFMSREAFAELTAQGKLDPLKAHELTLLRAYFTVSRWRSLRTGREVASQLSVGPAAIQYNYDMLPPVCPTCKALDGTQVEPESAAVFPPDECQCVTANYAIQMRVDWLAGIS